jgi:hypothetical protein
VWRLKSSELGVIIILVANDQRVAASAVNQRPNIALSIQRAQQRTSVIDLRTGSPDSDKCCQGFSQRGLPFGPLPRGFIGSLCRLLLLYPLAYGLLLLDQLGELRPSESSVETGRMLAKEALPSALLANLLGQLVVALLIR